MKKFFEEFKKFALKGNVMDLAIGVIIGGAFGAIVTSLTDNFIQPLINSIGGSNVGGSVVLPWVDTTGMNATEKATVSLNYGAFITAVINFFIIALVLFLLVKSMNKLMTVGKKKEEEKEEEPTTKTCPFCKSEIAIDATRCPHCTSEIKEEKKKKKE